MFTVTQLMFGELEVMSLYVTIIEMSHALSSSMTTIWDRCFNNVGTSSSRIKICRLTPWFNMSPPNVPPHPPNNGSIGNNGN